MPSQMITENTIPNFLLKLWKLVEDDQHRQCIQWDDTGFSFHVREPYSFSKCVLPLYFKHSNLNSFIRQLNMYGFRKVTNLDKGSLKQPTDHRDTLEFQHPYFVRGHVELLQYIKRKVSNNKDINDGQSQIGIDNLYAEGIPDNRSGNDTGKDLNHVLGDVRNLKEKQTTMDGRLNQMKKDNQTLWREIDRMRQLHMKQQQVVNKLIQLLVSLVQPSAGKRLGKRQLLAIGPGTADPICVEDQSKHCRPDDGRTQVGQPQLVIAEVTDELEPDDQPQYQERRNSLGRTNANQQQVSPQNGTIPNTNSGTGSGREGQHHLTTLSSAVVVSSSQNISTKSQNGVCVSSSSEWTPSVNSPVTQPEFSEYLDYIQSDIDSLKTILTSESFNLDQDSLSSLFTMADESNTMTTAAIQSPKPNAEIFAAKMHAYKPAEMLESGAVPKQRLPPTRQFSATDVKPSSLPPLAPLPPSLQSFQRLNEGRPSLPSIPPLPPNLQCFQRQSSVPAYYGHGMARMTNQVFGTPSMVYGNCSAQPQPLVQSPQQFIQTQQPMNYDGLPQVSERSTEDDESDLILSSLFAAQATNEAPSYEHPQNSAVPINYTDTGFPQQPYDRSNSISHYDNVRNVFLKGRSRSYVD